MTEPEARAAAEFDGEIPECAGITDITRAPELGDVQVGIGVLSRLKRSGPGGFEVAVRQSEIAAQDRKGFDACACLTAQLPGLLGADL